MKRLCLMMTVFFLLNAYAAPKTKEVEVPRTAYQDIYKYYVLEESKKATNFQVIYKRVGASSFDYGIVEINCAGKVIRLLGKSVKSVRDINTDNPSPWIAPPLRTIESDMIAYVCR